MKNKIVNIFICLITSLLMSAQNISLTVNSNIKLLKDSVKNKSLVSALTVFLISSQKSNSENKLVLESEKAETYILLDEINGITKNEKLKDDFFYKPYLENIVPLKDNKYLIQVSFIGINDDIPTLNARFEIIAHYQNNSFLFSSPLVLNTQKWKTEKIGNIIFHYAYNINQGKVNEFSKYVTSFDKKLKVPSNKITEFYCCENFNELQKLIGISYKADYNGETENILSSSFENRYITVLGNNNSDFSNFDPHDLWHDRLSLVIARSLVNKSVDEGCAYLYGGSWGISWEEIYKQFKEQIVINKTTNWLEIKEKPVGFKTNGFNNSADYIISALLVKKIEAEKGFTGVWELLNCGKSEKGNENYYKSLEKLTGIKKENYNDSIWKLINNEN